METEEAAMARMKRMEHPDMEEEKRRFNQMMDEQEREEYVSYICCVIQVYLI